MLGTIGTIASGLIIALSPVQVEANNTAQETQTINSPAEASNLVRYAVTADSSEEELLKIKAAAEEAGMGFRYAIRGVSKKKLVIDMVIEHGNDYTLERLSVKRTDGIQYVQWTVDADGNATAFVNSDENYLTELNK